MTRIAVIIPTLATRERGAFLRRAIGSARDQRGVDTETIVVINGDAPDRSLLRWLSEQPDIRSVRLREASMPAALLAGRQCVESEYFAELDDDDELLPDALSRRLAVLQDDTGCDAVVSQCIERCGDDDRLSIPSVKSARRDPLRVLLEHNWLLPGSALFRSARVGVDFFNDMPSYLEWTWLGLLLTLHRRVAFLDEPTAVHHVDLPHSVQRTRACQLGRPAALRALLELDLPDDARRILQRRLGNACNTVARLHADERDRANAWRWHLRSLRVPGGLRHLSFTRKLIF